MGGGGHKKYFSFSFSCVHAKEGETVYTDSREKRRRGRRGMRGRPSRIFLYAHAHSPTKTESYSSSFFFFSFCGISAECTVVVEPKEADEEIQNAKMWTEIRQLWKRNRRDFTVVKILVLPSHFLCFSTVILWHFAFFSRPVHPPPIALIMVRKKSVEQTSAVNFLPEITCYFHKNEKERETLFKPLEPFFSSFQLRRFPLFLVGTVSRAGSRIISSRKKEDFLDV